MIGGAIPSAGVTCADVQSWKPAKRSRFEEGSGETTAGSSMEAGWGGWGGVLRDMDSFPPVLTSPQRGLSYRPSSGWPTARDCLQISDVESDQSVPCGLVRFSVPISLGRLLPALPIMNDPAGALDTAAISSNNDQATWTNALDLLCLRRCWSTDPPPGTSRAVLVDHSSPEHALIATRFAQSMPKEALLDIWRVENADQLAAFKARGRAVAAACCGGWEPTRMMQWAFRSVEAKSAERIALDPLGFRCETSGRKLLRQGLVETQIDRPGNCQWGWGTYLDTTASAAAKRTVNIATQEVHTYWLKTLCLQIKKELLCACSSAEESVAGHCPADRDKTFQN